VRKTAGVVLPFAIESCGTPSRPPADQRSPSKTCWRQGGKAAMASQTTPENSSTTDPSRSFTQGPNKSPPALVPVGWDNCLSTRGQLQGGRARGARRPASASSSFIRDASRVIRAIERIPISRIGRDTSHQKTGQEKRQKPLRAVLAWAGAGEAKSNGGTEVLPCPKRHGPTLAPWKVVHTCGLAG